MASKPKITKEYGAASIDVNLGLDQVRAAPQVYIGDMDSGGILHILVEPLDNATDESLQNSVKNKTIDLVAPDDDGYFWVADYGRGIPVEIHPTTKQSTLTTVLTTLSAGGKMRVGDNAAYKKTRGVHGMGVAITNALAEHLEAWTFRSNKWHHQEFRKGKPINLAPKVVNKAPKLPGFKSRHSSGTIIRFKPDYSLFDKGAKLSPKAVRDRLELWAYLHSDIKFRWAGKKAVEEFHQPKGLPALIELMLADFKAEANGKIFRHHDDDIDLAMIWSNHTDEVIRSYVSGVPTTEGGTHVSGINQAIAKAMEPFRPKRGGDFRSDDLRVGLICVINAKVEKPRFTTQTKTKLATPEITTDIRDALIGPLSKFLNANKALVKEIIRRAIEERKAMDNLKFSRAASAKLKTQKAGKTLLPAKLADSLTRNPEERELFLVEGDGAGGCHVGSTKIQLINGKTKTLKQLVAEANRGIVNYGYAHSNKTGIHVVPIDAPRLIKHTRRLTEVTLDNGKKVRCTRDHSWKLRNGKYLRADKLEPGTSLMPHYERIQSTKSGDRRQIWHPGDHVSLFSRAGHGGWQSVYQLIAQDLPEKRKRIEKFKKQIIRFNVHHKDFDTTNDTPSNLRIISEKNHRILHAAFTSAYAGFVAGDTNTHAVLMRTDKKYRKRTIRRTRKFMKDYWANEENRLAQAKRTRRHMADPENRQQISESVKEWWTPKRRATQARRATIQSADPKYQERRRKALHETRKRKFLEIAKRCKPLNFATFTRQQAKWMQENNATRIPFKAGFRAWREFFASIDELKVIVKPRKVEQATNHKVVSVRNILLKKPVPVYDASIVKYRNYALAAGVYVHNTAKDARDKQYQEVLPLSGKMLNVIRATPDKVVKNASVLDILQAVGYDPESKKIDNFRVGKLIFLADSDADGDHISLLMSGVVFKIIRPLLDRGQVYVVDAPLFTAQVKSQRFYGATLKEIQAKVPDNTNITRIKGWGEINPDVLKMVAFDPKTRVLKRLGTVKGNGARRFVDVLGQDTAFRKELLGIAG